VLLVQSREDIEVLPAATAVLFHHRAIDTRIYRAVFSTV